MISARRGRASAPLVSLAAAMLGGCAMSPPPAAGGAASEASPAPPDLREIERAEEAMRAPESELLAARAGQEPPECARACLLQDNVCALAERICAIAARYPATDPVRGRCVDGQARCRRARDTVVPRCGCRASQ
jgi:hypothetical protein